MPEEPQGWLILDKPSGMSSAQAVARVKRSLGARKAGHAGTLDPLGTGVLPIALSRTYTKQVSWLQGQPKTYRFRVRFGARTDTDDSEGQVMAGSDRLPSTSELEAVLGQFLGEIAQLPPRYSALKVGGRNAYALAREGRDFELSPRQVQVHDIHLASPITDQECDLLVKCGKGCYMRSLARDLAWAVGSQGHLTQLRRLQVGPFGERDAVSLAELSAKNILTI